MSGTGGFQTQVYDQPAAAVAGNAASQNPWANYDAGPGALVAGAAGVITGRFAWVAPPTDPNGNNSLVFNTGAGIPDGFVMNEQQALNVTYLSFAGQLIQPGFMVTLRIAGDIWCVNDGATEATPGMKAYADIATGKVNFAATGNPLAGASFTAAIAASTFAVTASIADDIMTVTAVGSGVVVPGAAISGTNVASGSRVGTQLTPLLAGEAAGGVGRYYVTPGEQTVASTTVSGTYGTMTVSAVASGVLVVDEVVSGSGVAAGTTITALGTGTGGVGTYIVNNTQTVGSEAMTTVSNIETKWYARSSALPGEIIKISSYPLG